MKQGIFVWFIFLNCACIAQQLSAPRLNLNQSKDSLVWSTIPDAFEYELEWVFIDKYYSVYAGDFFKRKEPVRIVTKKNKYKKEIYYPEGRLHYRVRAVGKFNASQNFDEYNRKYSSWSNIVEIDLNSNNSFPARDNNWQYVVQFSEDAKRKDVIAYHDGLLQKSQTASTLFSDGNTIIVDHITDYENRPVLSILPSAFQDVDLNYIPGFSKNNSGEQYSAQDFASQVSPNTLDTSSGSGEYFSPNNQLVNSIHQAYVPDAEGYPFSLVEYTHDNTGKIRRSSGIGKTLRLGSDYETQYLYGQANQSELIRIFGNNVGPAGHYKKNVTRDPNGQFSLSYIDQNNNLIAGALTGGNPANLELLPHAPQAKLTTAPVSLNNNVVNNQIYTSNRITNITNSPYHFRYEFNGVNFTEDFDGEIQPVCSSCKYLLEISLTNPNGVKVELTDMNTGLSSEIIRKVLQNPQTNSCANFNQVVEFADTLDQIGEYILERKLSLLTGTIDTTLADLYDTQLDLKKRPYLELALKETDTTSCFSTCQEMCDYLYANDPQAKSECDNNCNDPFSSIQDDLDITRCYEISRQLDELATQTGQPRDNLLEKCHLDICHEFQASDYFDYKMSLIKNYNIAKTRGFYNPLAISPLQGSPYQAAPDGKDPFFQYSNPGFSLLSEAKHTMFKYIDINPEDDIADKISIWDYTDYLAEQMMTRPELVSTLAEIKSFLQSNDQEFKQNLAWFLFKGEYTLFKRKLQLEYIRNKNCLDWEHGVFSGYENLLYESLANNEFCGILCPNQAVYWTKMLKDSCIIEDQEVLGSIENHFEDYCFLTCGPENPYAFLTEDDIANGHPILDNIQALVGEDCPLSKIAVESPYEKKWVCAEYCDSLKCDTIPKPGICFQNARDAIQYYIEHRRERNPFLSDSLCYKSFEIDTVAFFVPATVGDKPCQTAIVDTANHLVDFNKIKTLGQLKWEQKPGSLPERRGQLEYSGYSSYVKKEIPVRIIKLFQKLNKSVSEYQKVYVYTNCPIGKQPACDSLVAGIKMPEIPPTPDPYSACVELKKEEAENLANSRFKSDWEDFQEDYRTLVSNKCFDSPFSEKLTYMSYQRDYHYTLYYYDQAGNLVQTVPPAGVDTLTANEVAAFDPNSENPEHKLLSRYAYSSLNQLIRSESPDGGTTQFWYNALQQLRLSQNAQQAIDGTFKYTRYDKQSRIIETGLLKDVDPGGIEEYISDSEFPDPNVFTLADIVQVYYDELPVADSAALCPDFTGSQHNLRGRIAASVSFKSEDDQVACTCYSYDPLGNVASILQNITGLGAKRIDYYFDVISGNIIEIAYQSGKEDQFFHKYEYDADNRIISVHTSLDGQTWANDARYKYFPHGPLARLELGQDSVQGIDYVYTIQGWLKGVNSNTLNPARDPGKDGLPGSENENVARDAYGFTLGYFPGDYKPIGSLADNKLFEAKTEGSGYINDAEPLYNGNISHMVTAIDTFMQADNSAFGAAYKYDQLNRLVASKIHRNQDIANNVWLTASGSTGEYETSYTYDANGNITHLNRNAHGASDFEMDRLTYQYEKDENERLRSNKLYHVDDDIPFDRFEEDLDDQGDFDPNNLDQNNYDYDAIGNLTRDRASGIETIAWNSYGKVNSILKANNAHLNLNFAYDGSQNRILKHVWNEDERNPVDKKLYYVRGADGNVMAMYEVKEDTVMLKDFTIYGADRLGLLNIDKIISHSAVAQNSLPFRQYELNNHLGNVLATVSDRKTNANDDLSFFKNELLSGSDYYPFGTTILDKRFLDSTYIYGFQGHEKVAEVKGSGNHYTAQFWEYYPNLGKRWNVDPIMNASFSGYSALSNNPINYVDVSGAIPEQVDSDNQDVLESAAGALKMSFSRILYEAEGFMNWANDDPDAFRFPDVVLDDEDRAQVESFLNESDQYLREAWRYTAEKVVDVRATAEIELKGPFTIKTGIDVSTQSGLNIRRFGADLETGLDSSVGYRDRSGRQGFQAKIGPFVVSSGFEGNPAVGWDSPSIKSGPLKGGIQVRIDVQNYMNLWKGTF